MKNRIRALRKERGWTLSELAARITPDAPTAQTLARLETGTRTLSLPWLEKIGRALDVSPQDLLTLSDGPSSPMIGVCGVAGIERIKTPTDIDLSVAAKDPVALTFDAPRGRYQAGDMVVFDRIPDAPHSVIDEALIETKDGRLLFGSVFPGDRPDRYWIAAPPPKASLHEVQACAWIAKAVTVIRRLT
ncbi:MAG: helix-turn-helix transcriptional regulator [Pseudomonadota bacterium]